MIRLNHLSEIPPSRKSVSRNPQAVSALRQLTTAPVGVSLFDAIDQQLGLKLEEQKIPTPVIVVDQVNEKPTGNSPDLATRFPAPPQIGRAHV